MAALRRAHRGADGDRLGGRTMDAPALDFGAGARGFAGRGDRAVFDADLAADPLHPLPGRDLVHDRFQAAHVDRRQRTGRQVADRDAGHLRLRIGPAHHVGIDDRPVQMRRRHQRLDRIAAADLQRHDPSEVAAGMRLHQRHRPRDGAAVGQPLLSDQRRAHVGDRGDPIVIVEIVGRHELDAAAIGIQPTHVQQPEIGTAAAPGAEDPSPDSEGFDIVEGDVAKGHGRRRSDTVVKEPSPSRAMRGPLPLPSCGRERGFRSLARAEHGRGWPMPEASDG